MINELEIVKFAGEHYALVQDRDEYTAYDTVMLRRVQHIDNHFCIRLNGALENIDDDMDAYIKNRHQRMTEHEWFMKTRWD